MGQSPAGTARHEHVVHMMHYISLHKLLQHISGGAEVHMCMQHSQISSLWQLQRAW